MTTRKLGRTLLVAALALSLVLSITGGTIAWFTDSVESSTNVITSGNLDIELYHTNKTVSNEKVGTSTKLFKIEDNTLWEPGMVVWENLTVKNEGNLHLYYDLGINVSGENYVIDGNNQYGLSGVLKMAVLEEAIDASASRDAVMAKAQNGALLASASHIGNLAASASKTYGVIVYWEPSANDNNWNVNNGKALSSGNALTINLGVKLNATQMDAELDAFDKDYDADAKLAKSYEDLQAALNAGGTVVLEKDITLPAGKSLMIPAGKTVTLNLNGKTITGNTTYGIRANGDLTLTGNGTVTGEFGALNVRGNVVIENGTFVATGAAGKTHHCVYAGTGANIVINGGSFIHSGAGTSDSGSVITAYDYDGNTATSAIVTINGGTFTGSGTYINCLSDYGGDNDYIIVKGGTFSDKPSTKLVATGYEVTNNGNGTWTVSRKFADVTITPSADKVANGDALANAISNITNDAPFLQLPAGEYKMPSVGVNKEVTIVGTKDTVIDVTMGAYMEGSKVSFEGVTIKGGTGMVNGNGSDYAALYTPNVTYTNCTFDGPFRIGRDGATFINCTFTNLGNDYVWTYGNDATFKNCTFNSEGKALLIYSDGGNEVSKVVVENCTFNATQGAKAGAIANQNCAAIEIDNYGNGVNLTTNGNTYNDTYFSGEWRIKNYATGGDKVIVNDTEYTTIALDGKTMTKDASNNVTLN